MPRPQPLTPVPAPAAHNLYSLGVAASTASAPSALSVDPAAYRLQGARPIVAPRPFGAFSGFAPASPTPAPFVQPEADATELSTRVVDVSLHQGLCTGTTSGAVRADGWMRLEGDRDRLGQRRDALMRLHPSFDEALANVVVATLLQRAHAEYAEPRATHTPLHGALTRAIEQHRLGRPYARLAKPHGAPHLMLLTAPHYDGCLFDPTMALGGGGQGSVYVGVTKYGVPLAVKSIDSRGKNPYAPPAALSEPPDLRRRYSLRHEARQLREAAEYDCVHQFCGPRWDYFVIPLFSGDLTAHANAFLRLCHPPQPARSDGTLALPTPLRGARYILAEVLQHVADLHDDMRRVHQDIKPQNIFVAATQERFFLGDFGLCDVLDEHGRVPYRGCSPQYAAPEQLAQDVRYRLDQRTGGKVDAKVDLFAVGLSMVELLLAHCPTVRAYRAAHFPTCSGMSLLPKGDDRATQLRMHDDYVYQRARFDAAAHDALPHVALHFRSVHDSIDFFDRPLGDVVRGLLAYAPEARPTARQALQRMDDEGVVHGLGEDVLAHTWQHYVARYEPHVRQKIDELRGLQRRLAGAPLAPGG